MSITFGVVGAEYKQVVAKGYDGEDLFEEDGSPVMETVSSFPEINMCDLNAHTVLYVLGLPIPEDGCGSFSVAELPDIRRRIIMALNGELPSREWSTRAEPGKMVVHVGSLSEEALRERLMYLQQVVIAAQENGKDVYFA